MAHIVCTVISPLADINIIIEMICFIRYIVLNNAVHVMSDDAQNIQQYFFIRIIE